MDARAARLDDLGGAVALDLPARVEDDAAWGAALYREDAPEPATALRRLVPYHLWDNRAPGPMQVWMRRAAPAEGPGPS